MATIANLDINLVARTQKTFDKPLKMSGNTVVEFSKSAESGFDRIASASNKLNEIIEAGRNIFGTAFGSAKSIFNGLVSSVSQLDSELSNLQRFGLSSSGLGQFKVLAAEGRVEMDKLVDTAKDLSIRIGEANLDGQGEIFDTFGRLGLNVEELAGLKPEEQLKAFANAISNVENETAKLTFTDILLSDAGTDVLNLLDEGAEKFDEAADFVDRFGGSLSDIEVQKVQEAQNAFNRLDVAVETVWNRLVAEASPAITFFANAAIAGLEASVELANDFVQILSSGFKALTLQVGSFIQALDAVAGTQATTAFNSFISKVEPKLKELEETQQRIAARAGFGGIAGNQSSPSGNLSLGSGAAASAIINDRRQNNRGIELIRTIIATGLQQEKTLQDIKRALERRGIIGQIVTGQTI